jgi:hypothetical protein
MFKKAHITMFVEGGFDFTDKKNYEKMEKQIKKQLIKALKEKQLDLRSIKEEVNSTPVENYVIQIIDLKI